MKAVFHMWVSHQFDPITPPGTRRSSEADVAAQKLPGAQGKQGSILQAVHLFKLELNTLGEFPCTE